MADKNIFETFLSLDVNDKVEKKETGKKTLSYLSWAWAWAEFKKRVPDAHYEIKMFDGLPYIYDEKTGYMVFTSVTAEGITHDMWLPVMDSHNDAMKSEPYEVTTKYGKYTVNSATMFDVNKTIMRCLVKNLAMFGLGLYIYAGEDLPEDAEPRKPKKYLCDSCGSLIKDANGATAEAIAIATHKKYGRCLCYNCITKQNEEAKKNVEAMKDSGIPVEVHE